MALVRLDHINITTTKLAETRAFYMDVLGLTEGDRPDLPFPGHWLYAGDEDVVHLMTLGPDRGPSNASALDHFAFKIDDFDAAIATLEAHGIKYRASGVAGREIRQIFLADPNGVTIELNYRGQ